jgi:hypothetical protein
MDADSDNQTHSEDDVQNSSFLNPTLSSSMEVESFQQESEDKMEERFATNDDSENNQNHVTNHANKLDSSETNHTTGLQSSSNKMIQPPVAPKKPMSGYFLYMQNKRVEYKKEHPNAGVTELTKALR